MFTKMYILSNTDFGCLVNEALEMLETEEITKDNYKDIANEIWEGVVVNSPDKDIHGLMVIDKHGRWNSISNPESLEYLVYREYRDIIEDN